jgi:hypothetical protein
MLAVVACLDRRGSHACCERSHDPLLDFSLAIKRHDIEQTLKLGQDRGRFATGLWQLNRDRLEANGLRPYVTIHENCSGSPG